MRVSHRPASLARRAAARCVGQGTRRGTVLIVTIVVVFALAGLVLVMCRSMALEAIASANEAASVQAAAVARGAEQYVLGILSDQSTSPLNLPEEDFAAVPVGEGWFWVLRPDYGDDSLPAYGLVDECSKLDINAAGYASLMRLPGMTDDVAAAIVDWRDDNPDISSGGAESEYYLSLPEPYYCKNAPFETVEELRLVRNVTPQLLYGDGSVPALASVSMAQTSSGRPFSDPMLARGIYHLLTVYSAQPNTAADGSARININDGLPQRQRLRAWLNQRLGTSRGSQIMDSLGPEPLSDIFAFYFRGQLTRDELEQVADFLTTDRSRRLVGLVNVNTAPREVLLCIDGLDSADVDKLLSQRRASGSNSTSIAWVPEALGQKAIGLGGRITGRSTRYSADIVAVSGDGRAFKHVRIVVDASGTTPTIIYRRDLTSRGWPMDRQILASLRAGQGPGNWQAALGTAAGGFR